jgi:hypothetical protein
MVYFIQKILRNTGKKYSTLGIAVTITVAVRVTPTHGHSHPMSDANPVQAQLSCLTHRAEQ